MLHSAVSLSIGTREMVGPPRLWANAVGGPGEISWIALGGPPAGGKEKKHCIRSSASHQKWGMCHT